MFVAANAVSLYLVASPETDCRFLKKGPGQQGVRAKSIWTLLVQPCVRIAHPALNHRQPYESSCRKGCGPAENAKFQDAGSTAFSSSLPLLAGFRMLPFRSETGSRRQPTFHGRVRRVRSTRVRPVPDTGYWTIFCPLFRSCSPLLFADVPLH